MEISNILDNDIMFQIVQMLNNSLHSSCLPRVNSVDPWENCCVKYDGKKMILEEIIIQFCWFFN